MCVSICQADLGLAELNDTSRNASWFIWFQSARQIWVWPNPNTCNGSSASRLECFNLPGRFGFGRTHRPSVLDIETAPVSICQADLGLAEHCGPFVKRKKRRSFNLPGRFGFGRTQILFVNCGGYSVSICQADLGLAELLFRIAQVIERSLVSICQADLGLAEHRCKHILFLFQSLHRFNLPGRFGFGRTQCDNCGNGFEVEGFNLPGRFGFGRTCVVNAPFPSYAGFNLPGRFGFGRTPII